MYGSGNAVIYYLKIRVYREETVMYKAVAFNCSPNREGNTNYLLEIVMGTLKKEGISGEIIPSFFNVPITISSK